jgi:ribosomal protein S18 acetylase RimI-like enzyme
MNLQIRLAVVEDAAGLAQVRVAAWRAAYPGIVPAAFLAKLDPEKDALRQREYLSNLTAEGCVLAAVLADPGADAGRVVGFCGFGIDRDQDAEYSGEVYALYVHPDFQRQGIGQRLMRPAADWLGEHGYARFLIWVLRDNHPARRFYEALGGRLVRERMITLGGEELPEVGYGYENSLSFI